MSSLDMEASSPSIPKYFMVPYSENVQFVGRIDLLSLLSAKLHETSKYQNNHRVALYGLGGVGKTQTALTYVYSNRALYNSIFWISAVNQATLLSEFQRIAILTKCCADMTDLDPSQGAMMVLQWLNAQTSWLLVVDNLDDMTVIDGFLPVNDVKKHTLITTRNPNADGIPAEGLEVDPLNQEEASNLLLIRAKLPIDCQSSQHQAEKIAKELGYLPLAIDQAAAFIRETKRKIEEFL